jgi:uncharacterized membrane protein
MDETIEGDATKPTGDPDIDSALQLVIARFPDEDAARAAFNEIKEAEREEVILLVDAAVVNRDDGNNLHVKDEQDWPAGVGALLGAGIGTILGTLGGPVGLVVGGAAGAAIGAAAAGSRDAGMSDERLMEFANSLEPGTSMVIVAVARLWSKATVDILTRAGGKVTTIALSDDLARQLGIDVPGT